MWKLSGGKRLASTKCSKQILSQRNMSEGSHLAEQDFGHDLARKNKEAVHVCWKVVQAVAILFWGRQEHLRNIVHGIAELFAFSGLTISTIARISR